MSPLMVYNKYVSAVPMLNDIFGVDNWCVGNYFDQIIIYCMYYKIEIPSWFVQFISNREKKIINITFKDTPIIKNYFDTNPHIDKNKPFVMNKTINNEKIIINTHIDKFIQNNMHVSLNNITVRKISMITCELEWRIETSINKHEYNDFHIYIITMNMCQVISQEIKKGKSETTANIKKLLDEIAHINESYLKDVFLSNNDYLKYREIYKKIKLSEQASNAKSTTNNQPVEPPTDNLPVEPATEPPAKKSKE